MSVYENVFQKIKPEDYLAEAVAAAAFIDTRKVETEHGIYWSIKDATVYLDNYYDEICMYAGSTGIAHYYLALWRVTKDAHYLNDAKEAARYLEYRWRYSRKLAKSFAPWAFTTGYGGVAHFLLELNEIAPDNTYIEIATEIAEDIIKNAKPTADGDGYYWTTYPGIVGDGSVVLYLLEAAQKLNRPDFKEFAVKAGRRYLHERRSYAGGGSYYLGVDPAYFGGGDDYVDPNFPMGTAGIGFIFLRLYEETGNQEFLDAVDGILDFHKAVALTDGDDAALLPHGLPNRPDTYYLNYCHGPAGTSRFYYKYYQVTGNPEYREWEQKLANGMIRAGAPENHSRGYWHIHCFCCGTAGMLNLFLGMWAAGEGDQYLEYAKRCGRHLLGWSCHEESRDGKIRAKWHQAFAYAHQDQTTTNIGMYDGIAGIGWALLQLYTALTGQFQVDRAVDDPYPDHQQK
jgi:lantibiotic modifying enzyme